jgi:hypothetical protein
MIVRRDHLDTGSIQLSRFVRTTTTPGSSLIAIACPGGESAPHWLGLADFLAAATERIDQIFKVMYTRPKNRLLTAT